MGNHHQESSYQIVENFINQEIPCQIVGSFKIRAIAMTAPFLFAEIYLYQFFPIRQDMLQGFDYLIIHFVHCILQHIRLYLVVHLFQSVEHMEIWGIRHPAILCIDLNDT